MRQPIAPDYGQQFLFPLALEDWVPSDHPARFLREFVDQLDLAKLGFQMSSSLEGRPAYAPGLLLKIWLYGYFHRIRSSRKLEVACAEHLSLIWLTGLIRPDHNTLWRFWQANQKALRALFKETVQVALHSGCIGLALQALDGTKIQAAPSSPGGWTKERMEKLLAQLDQALNEVDQNIVEENAQAPEAEYRLPASVSERQDLREQIQKGLAQLKEDGREHYHPVEPEARRMKVGQTNRYGYNAQAVADSQEGVIVACAVVREEHDVGSLVPMIEQARQNVGIEAIKPMTVADSGYASGADLKQAHDKDLAVLAPPLEGKSKSPYAGRHFVYDPKKQSVTCPQGKELDYEGKTTKKGWTVTRYRCHCRDCPVRGQCSKDPKGRQIEIWPYVQEVRAMKEKLKTPEGSEQWKQRCQIIERVFGQIKEHDGFRRWTVWGWEAVQTQWALICTTLNLRTLYKRWQAKQTSSKRGLWPQSSAKKGKSQSNRGLFELKLWNRSPILMPLGHA